MKKNEIQKKIDEETSRLTKLQSLREAREEEKRELLSWVKDNETNYSKIENELVLLNKQKMQAESALNSATTESQAKASESSLAFTQEKIDLNEETQFSLLEEKEELDLKLKEAEEFLKGSLETYKEIEEEVQDVTKLEQENITNLLKRIELLKEELPEVFKLKLDSLLKKNLKITPFTRLEGRSCEYCKLEVSRLDEENIEKNFQLKTCSGCSRLFIPKEASY